MTEHVLYLLFILSYMFCLNICMCTMFMFGAFQGQKKVLKTLKLGLQVVVSHHMHTGTKAQVLYKRNMSY